ncbi:alpha/beta hydrolase [Roseomonas hellenica]|uniref:Alpha/beta hydrolase n=1 Tax=Plastoroseomonas hellenica TaxID=2687306 RepID=A0ABS5F9E8_9PROT|nr:alpha/beta hydrolase [Plastoroseomonas hellenica]MBR0669166.1 alpha/beta hydrolase [Plastoroseomonas hellenica]
MLAGAAGAAALAGFAPRPAAAQATVRNVVLVHGAWADGSCWMDVILRLQAAGFRTTAVQNPLTSLADDAAATRRALDLQDGPTVLVGHSWGGAVITEAGLHPKVASLVYVAARAPDAGEDFNALAARFPTAPVRAGIRVDSGYASLTEEAFVAHFAGDLDRARARALHAVQQPIAETLFAGRTTVAAWRSKPCSYAVSTEDQTTAPELERFLAERMRARTIALRSSHLSMISHPDEIAALITAAAGAG